LHVFSKNLIDHVKVGGC